MAKVLDDFKSLVLRSNVVDLAVAVVVGAAFGALVTALVRDLITPLIALVFGKPDFSTLSFTINGSHFRYGDFVNYLISFLTIAAAVFFFVVQPLNMLMARRRTEPDVEAEARRRTECLSEIPPESRKCALCTSGLLSIHLRPLEAESRCRPPRQVLPDLRWSAGGSSLLPRSRRFMPRPPRLRTPINLLPLLGVVG